MPKLTGLPLRPLPGALLLTMFPALALAAFAVAIKNDLAKWGKVIKDANLQVN